MEMVIARMELALAMVAGVVQIAPSRTAPTNALVMGDAVAASAFAMPITMARIAPMLAAKTTAMNEVSAPT